MPMEKNENCNKSGNHQRRTASFNFETNINMYIDNPGAWHYYYCRHNQHTHTQTHWHSKNLRWNCWDKRGEQWLKTLTTQHPSGWWMDCLDGSPSPSFNPKTALHTRKLFLLLFLILKHFSKIDLKCVRNYTYLYYYFFCVVW